MSPGKRAILRVLWGPLAGHRRVLAPGESLRVGRTDQSDLVIARDPQVSAEHFQIGWDGARASIADLDSARGTLLGGERVSRAEVPNGGWIRAGDTHFRLHLEGHTPPRADDLPFLEKHPREKAAARDLLLGEPAPRFAVVDASRDHRLLQLLAESVDEHRSLYEGIQGEALSSAAPHLVALDPTSDLIDRLIEEGWGRRWMIFLTSSRPFREIRRHLRRFLLVEDDDNGRRLYFRYYDPRVLRTFLPACTPGQREDFFGSIEIESFVVEGEHAEPVRFTPDRRP